MAGGNRSLEGGPYNSGQFRSMLSAWPDPPDPPREEQLPTVMESPESIPSMDEALGSFPGTTEKRTMP